MCLVSNERALNEIICDNSQHSEVLLLDGCVVGVVGANDPIGCALTGYVIDRKLEADSGTRADRLYRLCARLPVGLKSEAENEAFVEGCD